MINRPEHDFEESAAAMSQDELVATADEVFGLLKRLCSRWKWRRRVETDWPVVPLATYGLALERRKAVHGLGNRENAIIQLVGRRMGKKDLDSVEALLHQDIIDGMGTPYPEAEENLDEW